MGNELLAGHQLEIARERSFEHGDIAHFQSAASGVDGKKRDRIASAVGRHENPSVSGKFDRRGLGEAFEPAGKRRPLADAAERSAVETERHDGIGKLVQEKKKLSVLRPDAVSGSVAAIGADGHFFIAFHRRGIEEVDPIASEIDEPDP